MRVPIVFAALLLLLAAGAAAKKTAELPHHLLQDLAQPAEHWQPPAVGQIEGERQDREWDNWRINSDASGQVQNEQQIGINPTNPNNLVAVWRDFRLGHRELGVGYSFDGGVTWNDGILDGPAQYPLHSDPGLTWDRQGNFYAVILSFVDTWSSNGLFVRKSANGGVLWGPPVTAIDAVPGVFEDKELIACDRSGGAHDGNLYVTWARFYNTQIYCVRSTDGGASFQAPVRVSDAGGVQWPIPVVGASSVLYVAWTNTSSPSIRLDRSTDGGAGFGSDVTVTSTYSGSDYINGDVLVFSYPAMDCDLTGGPHHGRLYMAYMDRLSGSYDMFLRWSDNGTTWSDRVRLNDDAVGNGRDQFHPWLSVGQDGSVNVIFYDRRNDPANLRMDLYFTQSLDGGLSFSPNERVTQVSSDPTIGLRAGVIGEYNGLAALNAGRVHAIWTDTREGNQDTYTAVIGAPTAAEELPAAAGGLRLAAAAPNPFREITTLAFDGAAIGRLRAEVFDVAGRRVCVLDASADGGAGTLVWDGRDESGRPAHSGLYFIRAEDGAAGAAARVLLLR